MQFDPPKVLVDADPRQGTYSATYHYPSDPPSTTVALALMEILDNSMTDLTPMYEEASVDADALDDLFNPAVAEGEPEGIVTFTYHDHTVMVKSHGRIVIQSPDISSSQPL